MKTLSLAVLSLSLACFATGASAADAPAATGAPKAETMHDKRGKGKSFKECDANGDGFLSRDEFTACYPKLAASFDEADANKDGKISREEMRDFRMKRAEARLAKRFAKCDKNKDNLLSSEEYAACFPRRADTFGAADANKDGQVSLDELRAAMAKRAGTRFDERFAKCDKNNDNFLTQEEFAACFPKRAGLFTEIDKEKAGKVSQEQIKAFFKARREARQ